MAAIASCLGDKDWKVTGNSGSLTAVIWSLRHTSIITTNAF